LEKITPHKNPSQVSSLSLAERRKFVIAVSIVVGFVFIDLGILYIIVAKLLMGPMTLHKGLLRSPGAASFIFLVVMLGVVCLVTGISLMRLKNFARRRILALSLATTVLCACNAFPFYRFNRDIVDVVGYNQIDYISLVIAFCGLLIFLYYRQPKVAAHFK